MPATWTWSYGTGDAGPSLGQGLPWVCMGAEGERPGPGAGAGLVPTSLQMESIASVIVEDEGGPGVRTGQRHRVFAEVAQAPLVALALHGWQWLRGRLAGKAPAMPRATLRLVAHLALGGRKTLALVEVEGQRYLVGGGGDTVTAIVAVQAAAQDHGGASTQNRTSGAQVPGECAG